MSNHKFIYSILFSHRIILLLGIVILFSGCANEDEPEQGPVNREEPGQEPVNRTVLIYMLSNNNLGSIYRFDTQNINDMLQVAASGGLNGGISLFTATDTIQIPSLYKLGKTNLVRLKKRL